MASTDAAARSFYETSKRLKAISSQLRNEFTKDMRDQAKPLLPLVRQAASTRFPSRNGLNRSMAKASRYRVQARTGARTAGVRIVGNKSDPRLDTQGRVVHPVPGRNGQPLRRDGKRIMVVQTVPEAVGYFSDTITEHADEVRDKLIEALARWVDREAGS